MGSRAADVVHVMYSSRRGGGKGAEEGLSVVAELALGTPLLPGESEFNQLARVVRLFGVPPPRMLSRSRNAHAYFVEVGGGLVSDGGASSSASSAYDADVKPLPSLCAAHANTTRPAKKAA